MTTQAKPSRLLADILTDFLRAQGHPNPEGWKSNPVSSVHPDHLTANEDIQRFLINRQLRILLGNTTLDTINLRIMLDGNGEIKTWLKDMEVNIVPFMVKNEIGL